MKWYTCGVRILPLAFLLCPKADPAFLFAQQNNQQSPTMQDTVAFLDEHVARKLESTCHFSDPQGDSADEDNEFDMDKVELLSDSKTIRLTYHAGTSFKTDTPPALRLFTYEFHLSRIDIDSIAIEQPYAIACNAFAKQLDERLEISSSPEWWLVASFGQDGQAHFPVESKAMAQRMQKALVHAAVLAGAGKLEPF